MLGTDTGANLTISQFQRHNLQDLIQTGFAAKEHQELPGRDNEDLLIVAEKSGLVQYYMEF
jgi:hypothetical protein